MPNANQFKLADSAPIQHPLENAGFLRLPAVLALVPVSRSTWLAWTKSGKAPKPVKLSERTTAWKVADIRAFLDAQAA